VTHLRTTTAAPSQAAAKLRGRLHPGPQRLSVPGGRQPARSNRDQPGRHRSRAARATRARPAGLSQMLPSHADCTLGDRLARVSPLHGRRRLRRAGRSLLCWTMSEREARECSYSTIGAPSTPALVLHKGSIRRVRSQIEDGLASRPLRHRCATCVPGPRVLTTTSIASRRFTATGPRSSASPLVLR
jgi:hypothetical protein